MVPVEKWDPKGILVHQEKREQELKETQERGVQTSLGCSLFICSIVTGSMGLKGVRGEVGSQGNIGPSGVKGEKGTFTPGSKGDRGERGTAGSKGDR